MSRMRKPFPMLLALLLCAGCAKVQPYRPSPLVPAETARGLEARRLSDPGLERYVEQALGRATRWPIPSWDLETLTLAALYFSPHLEIAREQLAVAQAETVAAGARPNPTLSLTPGIPSPWLFDLVLTLPIETHGKRGLRIEQARDLSSAARLALARTAWQVASALRTALLAYRIAEANLAVSRSAADLEAQRASLLERRLAAGEGARPSLQSAQLDLANARLTVRTDEGSLAVARAALAGAIGVPVAAMNGFEFTWPEIERLPSVASLSPFRIQRDAVLDRLDVRQALEEYAAADAALRLELARQYPDFSIGPGYQFEEKNNFFTIPFSLSLPVRNRNQGPIARAEAQRREARARFLAVQASAIAESQQALAAYRSAREELSEANIPILNQQRAVQMTQAALAAGESDRLQMNLVSLEGVAYARRRLQSLAQAQAALGQLEDSVERPLGPGELFRAAFSPAAVLAPGRARP